jgi:hypothetical protein
MNLSCWSTALTDLPDALYRIIQPYLSCKEYRNLCNLCQQLQMLELKRKTAIYNLNSSFSYLFFSPNGNNYFYNRIISLVEDSRKQISLNVHSLYSIDWESVPNKSLLSQVHAVEWSVEEINFPLSYFNSVSTHSNELTFKRVPKLLSMGGLYSISRLSLVDLPDLHDVSFFSVNNHQHCLEEISIINCPSLRTIDGLETISKILLQDCGGIIDISLLGKSKILKTLEIIHCWYLENVDCLSTCLALKSLTINNCSRILSVNALTNLTHLQVVHCSKISTISNIAPTLTDVELYTVKLTDPMEFNLLTNVKKAKLAECNITSIDTLLKSCHSLTLHSCQGLRENPFTSLSQLVKSVHSLTLWRCYNIDNVSCLGCIPDLVLAYCSELKNLKGLGAKHGNQRVKIIGGSHITSFASLKGIYCIELNDCRYFENGNDLFSSSLVELPFISPLSDFVPSSSATVVQQDNCSLLLISSEAEQADLFSSDQIVTVNNDSPVPSVQTCNVDTQTEQEDITQNVDEPSNFKTNHFFLTKCSDQLSDISMFHNLYHLEISRCIGIRRITSLLKNVHTIRVFACFSLFGITGLQTCSIVHIKDCPAIVDILPLQQVKKKVEISQKRVIIEEYSILLKDYVHEVVLINQLKNERCVYIDGNQVNGVTDVFSSSTMTG